LSTAPIHILHLEDSEIDHQLVALMLRKHSLAFEMERVETLEAFGQQLAERHFDVIVADYHLAGFNALDAWALFQQQPQRPPFILLSGAIGEAAAVEAIRLGFSDYLLKDHIGKLGHVIERAIEVGQARQAKLQADAELARSERRLAELAEHLQTRSSRSAPPSRVKCTTTSAARSPPSGSTWRGSGATPTMPPCSRTWAPPARCCSTRWAPANAS
jgi:two-component system sensor histidine kinase UhpB